MTVLPTIREKLWNGLRKIMVRFKVLPLLVNFEKFGGNKFKVLNINFNIMEYQAKRGTHIWRVLGAPPLPPPF